MFAHARRVFRSDSSPLTAAVVLALVCSLAPPRARAQAQQAEARSSGLEVIQIRPTVYAIFGAGANIVVQVGPDGAIVVDSGTAASADSVVAAIRQLTPGPVRFIFNTSADSDHVGGNEKLAKAGLAYNENTVFTGGSSADIVAREEVLLRMSAPTGERSRFATPLWPTETFTQNTKSLYANGEGIQAVHQPAAHSDGDSIVIFRRADVVAVGDIVDLRHFPIIDRASGGSIQGELDALNRLVTLAIPAMPLVWQDDRTVVVPGHGRLMDQAEVVEYRDMVTIVRDNIRHLMDKRMTLEQIKAANPTAGYRKQYGSDTGAWATDMFVEAIYRDLLKPAKKP